jgi:hypothetical protein
MFSVNMRFNIAIFLLLVIIAFSCEDSDGPNASGLQGKGGSLARFAIANNYLYSVDDESLNVYQIMGDGSLEKINSTSLGSGVETIFAGDHWLYIGKNDAMIIYDIKNAANPLYVTSYSHFVACDPVVVQDTLAFVTLRTSNCRSSDLNTLDIINIKNPEQPQLLSNYTLESPYGLGIDGNLLFICEGDRGLKVLNVIDPFNAVLIKNYTDVNAYDVIPDDGLLILTGKDGIVQYDYTDHTSIKKLSTISVQQ